MARVVYLLPAHKINKHLGEALRSVDADPYGDKSILLVDNSLMPAMEMSDYCESLELSTRIDVVKCDERGVSEALNFGLNRIDSEYIARMDSDDLVVPGRTREQVDCLANNKRYSGLGSCALVVNDSGLVCGHLNMPQICSLEEMTNTLRVENPYIHPSVMMRTDVLQRFGYAEWGVNCEDWNLWVRMAKEGLLMGNLPGKFLKYRRHLNQVSVMNNFSERAVALRRTLSVLDSVFDDSYMFQRWYLERRKPSLSQLLEVVAREVPKLRNLYAARKLVTALGRAAVKNES